MPDVTEDPPHLFRIGSRPSMINRLAVGESLFLQAPPGRVVAFMGQVSEDIGRVGLRGKVSQSLIIGVEPTTREVYDIVKVTRTEE